MEWKFSSETIINLCETILKELREMSTTNATGLAALLQADADLETAITALTTDIIALTTEQTVIVADITSLQAQLAAVPTGDPDGQIASIAADLETKVAALNANSATITSTTAALTAAITPAPTS
jgi:hypothetical protein